MVVVQNIYSNDRYGSEAEVHPGWTIRLLLGAKETFSTYNFITVTGIKVPKADSGKYYPALAIWFG